MSRAILEKVCAICNREDGGIKLAEYLIGKTNLTHLFFGIESISHCGSSMQYLSIGETYNETIVCENGTCIVSSWGSWIEEVEKKYCEEEDVVQCGYCGHFTPKDEENWSDVICEDCGRNVATGE